MMATPYTYIPTMKSSTQCYCKSFVDQSSCSMIENEAYIILKLYYSFMTQLICMARFDTNIIINIIINDQFNPGWGSQHQLSIIQFAVQ